MKKEILFRGQHKDGDWCTGFLIIESNGLPYIHACTDEGDKIAWAVLPESVGQFTGIYDINNTKIFEGDIVTNNTGVMWEIVFNKGCFCHKPCGRPTNDVEIALRSLVGAKVIGNIFSNVNILHRSQTWNCMTTD